MGTILLSVENSKVAVMDLWSRDGVATQNPGRAHEVERCFVVVLGYMDGRGGSLVELGRSYNRITLDKVGDALRAELREGQCSVEEESQSLTRQQERLTKRQEKLSSVALPEPDRPSWWYLTNDEPDPDAHLKSVVEVPSDDSEPLD